MVRRWYYKACNQKGELIDGVVDGDDPFRIILELGQDGKRVYELSTSPFPDGSKTGRKLGTLKKLASELVDGGARKSLDGRRSLKFTRRINWMVIWAFAVVAALAVNAIILLIVAAR